MDNVATKGSRKKQNNQTETPKLRYNSFSEPNRRMEAQDSLREFAETGLSVKLVVKYLCDDDIAAILEMLVEEMRQNNQRIGHNNSFITNAEIIE